MFADLGIPFPLFAAPTAEALGYHGRAGCGVCGAADAHAFTARADGAEVVACYACLRGGRAWVPKDTEAGAVSADSAARGRADVIGIPRSEVERLGFVVIPHELEPALPDWGHALVPAADLGELIRTPDFLTWQGCQWLFCCGRPMVYVGAWKEPQFEAHAGGADPAVLFRSVVPGCPLFEWGRHAPLSGAGGPYVFRCQVCGGYRGYMDMP
jgi:hypothetical protein